MDIGQRIKRLRIQNELTLEELASRCELSKEFLSQVERDLTSPSIQTLSYITEALGMDLAQFFSEEKNEKIVFDQTDYFTDQREGLKIEYIVPNAQKNDMEPILIEIEAQSSSQSILPHSGEEFGYVLHGKLTLINGKKKHIIKKGQTFYLKGSYNHSLYNHTNSPAKVLWICTPPIF